MSFYIFFLCSSVFPQSYPHRPSDGLLLVWFGRHGSRGPSRLSQYFYSVVIIFRHKIGAQQLYFRSQNKQLFSCLWARIIKLRLPTVQHSEGGFKGGHWLLGKGHWGRGVIKRDRVRRNRKREHSLTNSVLLYRSEEWLIGADIGETPPKRPLSTPQRGHNLYQTLTDQQYTLRRSTNLPSIVGLPD